MKEKTILNQCKTCEQFIQHYAFEHNYSMHTINCGHCLLGNKKCKPDFCCEKYKKGSGDFFRKKEIEAIEILSRTCRNLNCLKNQINKRT